MGKSKDLASGNSAAYVETAGDTMSGSLNVNGGNLSVNSTSEAAHRYLYLNTGATNDGHILFQRAGSPKFQISSDTSNNLFTWNYAKNGTSHRINTDGSVIAPHQPSFMIKGSSGNKTLASGAAVASGMYNPTVLHNVGNHLNTSNAVFTAPVDGRYYMEWLAYTQTTGGLKNEYVATYLNFSNLGPVYGFHECGPDVCAQISGIFNMSANDTVQPYTYGHANRTQTYIGQHSYFSGHLLG